MCNYSKENFADFTVYKDGESTIFVLGDYDINPNLYIKLLEYFFEEEKLLKHLKNSKKIDFKGSIEDYVRLYKYLKYYIDDFNEKTVAKDEFDDETVRILKEELFIVEEMDNSFKIRNDKVGRIGEYIFSVILSEYYKFDCIIPKVRLSTSRNMSIYGIDVIYYSRKNNLILFGESKFTSNLVNGINLINKSLSKYENEIRDEFTLILSNDLIVQNELFLDKYKDIISTSLEVEDFINDAKVRKIGVPIFIAHGSETDIDTIFNKLKSIKKNKILNLETEYIVIDLPIYDKDEILKIIISFIANKLNYYEHNARSK